MSALPRVLIVAHGHPDRDPGGAEIAARALHRTLEASEDLESVLLARHDDPYPLHEGTVFAGAGAPREILFHASMRDRFLFRQAEPSRVWSHFRDALRVIRPDIVHFHHYVHLGLELLDEVRRYSARVPIVLTLHDFHAICHNEGQMVKTRGGALCHRASPLDCHGCFPSRSTHDFMLRERYVKGWLERVDRFVAPSRFLAGRYVEWGIDAARIEILENLLDPDADRDERAGEGAGAADAPASWPASAPSDSRSPAAPPETYPSSAACPPPPRPPSASAVVPLRHVAELPFVPEPRAEDTGGPVRADDAPLRLAFFGRINAIKGVDLLLEALQLLPREARGRVRLDVHGTGLERQPLSRRLALSLAARRLGPSVRLRGAYRGDELPALMREADWMIMPSRWWENSPVVILEARRHALPVICADIGGMAEKIAHGVTGLHFRANDPRALATRIEEVLELGEAGRRHFAARIAATSDQSRLRERHLALHRELIGSRAASWTSRAA